MTVASSAESGFDPNRLTTTWRIAIVAVGVAPILAFVRPIQDAILYALSIVVLLYASLDRPTTALPARFLVALTLMVGAFATVAIARDEPTTFFRAAIIAVAAWVGLYILHLLYPPGLERNEVLLGSFAGLTLGWVGWTAAAVGFALAFAALGVVAAVLIARRHVAPTAMFPLGVFLTPAVFAMVLIFA